MSHSEKLLFHMIRKSIKHRDQCTGSNKMNDDFGRIAKEQTRCISYRYLQPVVKMFPNSTFC